ncbi:MAG: hypothetical protein ABI685_13105 [Ferruginibacter sp.]
MSFSIVTTPPFEKELRQLAKEYPSVKNDIVVLAAKLLKEPRMGTAANGLKLTNVHAYQEFWHSWQSH